MVGLSPVAGVGPARQLDTGTRMKIGIVGYGKMGRLRHERIEASGRGRVVAVSDQFATPTGREDPYPNTMYWIRNYEPMLADVAVRRSVTLLSAADQCGHINSISVYEMKRPAADQGLIEAA